MRYLKRFNEELKASTYKKAGEKFTQMGHKRRGSELLDYATQVELKEKYQKLRQAQDENKEYGLFDITMTRGYGSNKKDVFSGKFYLQISFVFIVKFCCVFLFFVIIPSLFG